ncbi:hypothetical protein [Leptospira biflexa]|nr:hypothetical protein [Leptospira biflexa]
MIQTTSLKKLDVFCFSRNFGINKDIVSIFASEWYLIPIPWIPKIALLT